MTSYFPLPNGDMITHPELVARLVKPGDAILATLTPEKADAWHMASCIPGEAGELFDAVMKQDEANAIEELGDLEFYIEGLRTPLGITREETLFDVGDTDTLSLPGVAADVFDAAKRWVIYNKPLDRDLLVLTLAKLEYVLDALRTVTGISRAATLAGNILKLGERYSSLSYSDQQAQDRADKKEG